MNYRYGLLVTAVMVSTVQAQHDPAKHGNHMPGHVMPADASAAETRQSVEYPAAMKAHTLANMRDHLLALQQIQAALSLNELDKAADIAEQRLGMSALSLHGAHEASKFMPEGMRAAGSAMHRAASRFAVAAKDATATGDLKPVLGALSDVMGACVACHAGFYLK